MKQILTILYLFLSFSGSAQTDLSKQKVLFVLDASGSMETMWGDKNKMDIAKQTLFQLVDSIEQNNPNIEVGLRIFGHQYHRDLNNCKDSKLEVPFSKDNSTNFKEVLNKITPQGHTPIAYSLMESVNDFQNNKAINSIILITDGLENCNGNACDAAQFLKENRITINPFIIGLDIADSLVNSFDCIGTFINAKDEKVLNEVLQKTVKKATGKTTLSIHLKSETQKTLSNLSFSFVNAVDGDILNTYVHSLLKNGKADTLIIDPRGYLQLRVYTFPIFTSQSFELIVGQHNDIAIELPKSFIDFKHKVQFDDPEVKFFIRNQNQWIYNNTLHDFSILGGNFQLNTTFFPLKNETITPKADEVLTVNYAATGKLLIENNKTIYGSIYTDNWKLVKDLNRFDSDNHLKLSPGKYHLLYIEENDYNSENTHQKAFTIYEERTTLIKLFQ